MSHLTISEQAWRNEQLDLRRFRDNDAATEEATSLDVASEVEGRTRVDTVKEGLRDQFQKLLLG